MSRPAPAPRAHVGSGAEAVAAVPRLEAYRLPGQVGSERGAGLQLWRNRHERRHQQPGLVERWPPGRVSQWIDRNHSGGPQARRIAVWPPPGVPTFRFASGFPAVSPDGRQIAVSERTGRGNPDDRTSLVVWNTDGTNPRRIFHAEGSLMSPQWSPDGQWIVFGTGSSFVQTATQPAHIMIVKSDGSGARSLTTGPGNSGSPQLVTGRQAGRVSILERRRPRVSPERPNTWPRRGLADRQPV